MTREIKFRAWDKKTKSMIREVFEVGLGCNNNPEQWLVGDDRQTNNFELMQYTGLKDKNGREIFEMDILKGREIVVKSNGKFQTINPDEYYKVIFNKGQFVVKNLQSEHSTELPIYHFMFEDWMDVEKVGNIYENPELLKLLIG